MTVFWHLFAAHRRTYLWFWAVLSLFLIATVTLFGAFGDLAFRGVDITMWQGTSDQAPRWFLFVIGITMATVTLPVAIAHGITRKAFWSGAMAFVCASALLFVGLTMAGLGLETALFAVNGGVSRLPGTYPLLSFANALGYAGRSVLALAGYMLSGLVIGLFFYRLRVWKAILLTPLALLPVTVAQLPPDSPLRLRLGFLLAAFVVMVPMSFLAMRSVPIRPKKA